MKKQKTKIEKTKIEKQTRKRKAKRKKQIKKTREKDKKKQDEVFDVSLPRWSFFSLSPAGLSRLARNGAPPAPRRPSWVAAQGGCLVGRAAALVVASPVGRGTRLRGPVRK